MLGFCPIWCHLEYPLIVRDKIKRVTARPGAIIIIIKKGVSLQTKRLEWPWEVFIGASVDATANPLWKPRHKINPFLLLLRLSNWLCVFPEESLLCDILTWVTSKHRENCKVHITCMRVWVLMWAIMMDFVSAEIHHFCSYMIAYDHKYF